MKILLFYHSLRSDWNHGNAHFIRGICSELIKDGHIVKVYEPLNGWSYGKMIEEGGKNAINGFQKCFPDLTSQFYETSTLDFESILKDADLVVVHEWNDHDLVKKIGNHHKKNGGYKLLFHDTHHRAVSDTKAMEAYDLSGYDGVLAFGMVIRNMYLEKGWATRAWTWHEAADTNIFKPVKSEKKEGDLVWIGNWGDEERTEELYEFLIEPVKALNLRAKIYGVRYPEKALKALDDAGIEYGGWLPNYKVPEVFSKYSVTVHVPRKYYTTMLPGIPTIRPFEALACGIPLVSAPWNDAENLFDTGDFLFAHNGTEMKFLLKQVLSSEAISKGLIDNGLAAIRSKHTCKHRADELLNIYQELTNEVSAETAITV